MNYQKKNNYSTYKSTAKPPFKWRFDKFFVLLAAVFLLAPYAHFQLFVYLEGASGWISLICVALLMGIGYAAQAIYSRLRGYKRVRMDGTYENIERIFTPKHALGPYILAVIVFIIIFIIFKLYLVWRVDMGIDHFLDKYELSPFTIALTGAVFTVLGAISWFFDANFLISLRFFLPAIANLNICFTISNYFYKNSFPFFFTTTIIGVIFIAISYLLKRYYTSFMKTT